MKEVTKLSNGIIVLEDDNGYYLKREDKVTEVSPSAVVNLLVFEKESYKIYIEWIV